MLVLQVVIPVIVITKTTAVVLIEFSISYIVILIKGVVAVVI